MLFMLHHYLQRGITHDFILSLNDLEKDFYAASMQLEYDRQENVMNEFAAGLGVK